MVAADSGRPYELNRVLGILFGIVWLSAYLIYVIAGRSVEAALYAVLVGALLSFLLIAGRNYLWKKHPDEMLGLS